MIDSIGKSKAAEVTQSDFNTLQESLSNLARNGHEILIEQSILKGLRFEEIEVRFEQIPEAYNKTLEWFLRPFGFATLHGMDTIETLKQLVQEGRLSVGRLLDLFASQQRLLQTTQQLLQATQQQLHAATDRIDVLEKKVASLAPTAKLDEAFSLRLRRAAATARGPENPNPRGQGRAWSAQTKDKIDSNTKTEPSHDNRNMMRSQPAHLWKEGYGLKRRRRCSKRSTNRRRTMTIEV